MRAPDSLLDNFSNMQDEFNSSNNRIMRNIHESFVHKLKDLYASLDYFNEEYNTLTKEQLDSEVDSFKNKLMDLKTTHVSIYQKKYVKDIEKLKQIMCGFFVDKLGKGFNSRRKISVDIKKAFDELCDFNLIGLDEDVGNIIYNFKVEFEMKYINDEYCKDDFNKVIRSFKHELLTSIRESFVSSINDKQDIISRYASKGYEIIDHYAEMRCKK